VEGTPLKGSGDFCASPTSAQTAVWATIRLASDQRWRLHVEVDFFVEIYAARILALPSVVGAAARRGLGPVGRRLYAQLGSRKLQRGVRLRAMVDQLQQEVALMWVVGTALGRHAGHSGVFDPTLGLGKSTSSRISCAMPSSDSEPHVPRCPLAKGGAETVSEVALRNNASSRSCYVQPLRVYRQTTY
jgi:hypothetical protein